MIPRHRRWIHNRHDRGIVGVAEQQEVSENRWHCLLLLRNTDDFPK